jgi:hypothetical protein
MKVSDNKHTTYRQLCHITNGCQVNAIIHLLTLTDRQLHDITHSWMPGQCYHPSTNTNRQTDSYMISLTHGCQVDAICHRLVIILHSDGFLEGLHLYDLLTLVVLRSSIFVIWTYFYNLSSKDLHFNFLYSKASIHNPQDTLKVLTESKSLRATLNFPRAMLAEALR